jgi:hypothetical protein
MLASNTSSKFCSACLFTAPPAAYSTSVSRPSVVTQGHPHQQLTRINSRRPLGARRDGNAKTMRNARRRSRSTSSSCGLRLITAENQEPCPRPAPGQVIGGGGTGGWRLWMWMMWMARHEAGWSWWLVAGGWCWCRAAAIDDRRRALAAAQQQLAAGCATGCTGRRAKAKAGERGGAKKNTTDLKQNQNQPHQRRRKRSHAIIYLDSRPPSPRPHPPPGIATSRLTELHS